ncbi:X-X-X-Leu-X-X-Gly heptad repeat-containing protein [Virgibacillus sp. SK37]|uniref:X-X-X-Leu-X-X-Gly heptad repeat-containing protein n=1 Tax=Virgibacillus sp. SK37 TaxID=403957 RepID=UPI00059561C0|nr:X-X-X-Leu-X-X-Gly heptad repeat-containing protein [Virgibacillus sp. SK37]
MKIKKILFVLAAVLLVLPSLLVTASTNDGKTTEAATNKDGKVSSKDEVVYATFNANGKTQNIYVVNTLDISQAGQVADYGNYSSLKNLTDDSALKQSGKKVNLAAPEGKFYYQGNLDNQQLPWNFSISYYLDGKEITPKELAGKDGHVEVRIKTSANEAGNAAFFENYLLQISLSLDSEIYSNIKAEEGTIASAGKNKQVTFTVMPEKEGKFKVEADVVDFELNGIEITGVPSNMSIDEPDVDEMTGEMKSLTGAIADLNNGVSKLNNNVASFESGASELKSGSEQYKNGIAQLSGSSSELVNGSNEMKQALTKMSNSPGGEEEIDLSKLGEMTKGLSQISGGLRETAKGLTTLKDNYAKAYNALDQAMNDIPSNDISEEDMEKLYNSGADQQTIKKLVDTYTAARKAKGTYNEVKQGFDSVGGTLEGVVASLHDMADNVDTMGTKVSSSIENLDVSEGIAQLQEGLTALSDNYDTFHSGLIEYTNGVSQLSGSYQDIHNGIGGLADGAGELEDGVSELHNGTSKLHESTKDLPKQMTKEIDEMMSEYDKSDFEAVSFVSAKNKNVNSVQFVLKTKSIKYEEPEPKEKPAKKETGFWARLKDLFT